MIISTNCSKKKRFSHLQFIGFFKAEEKNTLALHYVTGWNIIYNIAAFDFIQSHSDMSVKTMVFICVSLGEMFWIIWRVVSWPATCFLGRVLRENPLVCSCDLHWLQQWQHNDRAERDDQTLTCFSNERNRTLPLSSLVIENCSELAFHFYTSEHFLHRIMMLCTGRKFRFFNYFSVEEKSEM